MKFNELKIGDEIYSVKDQLSSLSVIKFEHSKQKACGVYLAHFNGTETRALYIHKNNWKPELWAESILKCWEKEVVELRRKADVLEKLIKGMEKPND